MDGIDMEYVNTGQAPQAFGIVQTENPIQPAGSHSKYNTYPDSFINGAVYGILPMGMRLHAHSKRSYETLTSE